MAEIAPPRERAAASEATAKAALAEAKNRWDRRTLTSYRLGDPVCTFAGNYFGNIEQVEGNRFKVHVIGRVNRTEGYFFTAPVVSNFQYDRLDAPRWYSHGEFGPCQFAV